MEAVTNRASIHSSRLTIDFFPFLSWQMILGGMLFYTAKCGIEQKQKLVNLQVGSLVYLYSIISFSLLFLFFFFFLYFTRFIMNVEKTDPSQILRGLEMNSSGDAQ